MASIQARGLLPFILVSFPRSKRLPLLAAILAVKEGKSAQAEDVLMRLASQSPDDSTPAYLMLAQLSATSRNFARAAESLEKIAELQHRPGMVATLVALRERAGDVDRADAILDAAIEWWDNQTDFDRVTFGELIQEAAAFKLKHNKLEAAAKLFERMTKRASPAVRVEGLRGLICCMAPSDPTMAEFYEKQLPPLPSVDVAALERAAPPSHPVRVTDDGEARRLRMAAL